MYFLFSYLPTKLNRKIKANAREVEALLKGIITKREIAMRNGHADDSDLLGMLMQSNIKESHGSGSSEPVMTMDDIIGELKLFYFAGMETTSVLLTWTLVLLSMHPEWQDRAREEVLRVFGKNEPDINGTNNLKVVSSFRKLATSDIQLSINSGCLVLTVCFFFLKNLFSFNC